MLKPFDGKRVLITGGTGSLGKVLVGRLLAGEMGDPAKVIIFSHGRLKRYRNAHTGNVSLDIAGWPE